MHDEIRMTIGGQEQVAVLGSVWRVTEDASGVEHVLEFTEEVMRDPEPYILEWCEKWADIESYEASGAPPVN